MSTTVRALKETAKKTKEAPASPEASRTPESAVSAPSILPPVAIAAELIEQAASGWWAKLNDRQRERINGRFERGKAIALAGEVSFTDDPEVFKVRSQSTRGDYRYTVTLDPDNRSCSCPDVDAPYHVCKHVIAAYILQKALELAAVQPEPESAAAHETPQADPDAEIVASNYQIRYPKDTIVYAKLAYQGRFLLVEVLWIENGRAIVRALPRIENGEAIPNYPFPSPFGGDTSPRWSTCEVNTVALTNVRVYC